MSLNPFVAYQHVRVGTIPKAKLERALKGLIVRLTNAELSGNRVMLVHPANARAINKAKRENKGLSTGFTPFEAMADVEYHDNAGEGMDGGSLWSWIKQKAYPWLKQNWKVIKPVVSKIADVAIPAAAAALGAPQAGATAREALKGLTGVGLPKRGKFIKGSQEAREYMKKLRGIRTAKGGSFRTA